MTNLGFQAAYNLFNLMPECVCERAFLPDADELEEHARTSTPLFSYESQTPASEFDIVAFSLPFEEDYPNIPRLLNLIGIPVNSSQRPSLSPLVMAGGVAVSLNPLPVAGFFDLFLIGEAEGAIEPFVEAHKAASRLLRLDALRELDRLKYVFIPSLYDYSYDGATLKGMSPKPGAKARVVASKNLNLDAYPIPRSFIVTPESEFKGAYLAEIERGCPRGCRFCAAGFLYLPPRWRDAVSVKDTIRRGVETTGKAGLVGTAVSEYPWIKETIEAGIEAGGTMTLSSLRLDMLDAGLVGLLKKAGYQTVTLAPEAGSGRLRNVINKCVTDADIMEAARLVAEAGFLKMKLYFLIGLPTETDGDAAAIVELVSAMKGVMKRGGITLSVNPFIPKPAIPFQWAAFEDAKVIEGRLSIIKRGLSRVSGVIIKSMSVKDAFVQAYISRADPRAGAIIAEASEAGWRPTVRKYAGFMEGSVYRGREKDELLPWDVIDHGLKRQYLWKEYQKGLCGKTTPPCDVGACLRCGVCVAS
ncbi:MAG: radical SAM protein [Deltaproteobacteria bacterium]|nr:radical SAM protein [Deltaproteobacteria bacterium]